MASGVNSTVRTSRSEENPAAPSFGFGHEISPSMGLGVLLAITALAYIRSLSNEFVLDDYAQIVNNPQLGDWSFIWKSMVNNALWFSDPLHPPAVTYYRPLQNVWFALNFHLFGLNPIGWHAAMVGLHLAVVWLAYRVASLLAKDRWTGLVTAALFALMPIHAGAVTCVFAIGTPLGAMFELAAFEFYLRGYAGGGADAHRSRWLGLSLAAFSGALLSYDSAIVLPALIAAHALIFENERSETPTSSTPALGWKILTAIWPYAITAIAYLGLRYWVLGYISRSDRFNSLTGIEVLLTAPSAIATYITLLAMPWRAGPAHPMQFVHSVAEPEFYLPLLELLALCSAAVVLLRRNPRRRLYGFCFAWFLIALAPILRLDLLFFKFAIQDRYLYLPSFGVFLMAADLAVSFARRNPANVKAIWFGIGTVAIGYAALLLPAEHYWHDEAALYARCIEAEPDSGYWHHGLGLALKGRGDLRGARDELQKVVALEPQAGPDVYYELGRVYEELGDRRAAEHALAERIKQLNPPRAGAYADLAIAADAAGDSAQADAALKRAEAMPGGSEFAAVTRAQIRIFHGDPNGAQAALRDFLKNNPDSVQALAALGAALLAAKDYNEALDAYRHAAAIAPADPAYRYKMALILHRMGRDREAHDECAAVVAALPYDLKARALMAEIARGGPRD
ncbi:MAG TPA: tetratricopeptide repeat protein [Candidatus Binataceae bacterium]|nr:tetratricopeptide repeat protein [Candidatus Binataceae bacterium]